jgi:hypothetical protein
MLGQTGSPRSREIRQQLLELQKTIPSGARTRVLGGDAHDRVENANPKQFVTASRKRIAGWIGELLSLEKDSFREIRR